MLKPLPSSMRVDAPASSLPAPVPVAPLAQLAPVPPCEPPRRVLDFDIENRPLSYWYDGKCTAEVTAIAARFIGERKSYVWLLTTHKDSARKMLEGFRELYEAADMVTGHYIRRHDLGIIQAACVELNLPMLGSKLTQDTRLDLKKFQDIAKSQEALGAMLGLWAPKEHMSQTDWREANRLTRKGLAQTRRRVRGDIEQHIELRAALIERRLLKAPRMWHPS